MLVACCGNPLAGDDAFGHLVAEQLLRDPRAGVEVLDLAMNPASLLDQNLESRRVLLIVDAAEAPGAERGTILECNWGEPVGPKLSAATALSTHGLSIADQLELAHRLGVLSPVVRVIAMAMDETQAVAGAMFKSPEAVLDAVSRVRQMVGNPAQ